MITNRFLFKGKRKDTHEWVEGYYCCITEDHTYVKQHYIIDFCINTEGKITITNSYEVIAESVAQFTGKTDRNWKKAFDGDIIKVEQFSGFPPILYVIKWHNNDTCYYIEEIRNDGTKGTTRHFTEITNVLPIRWEIIGNIYDDPDCVNI